MGSSKKQTTGYRYYMGLHFGVCHGPVDAVQNVIVGEREAWRGSQTTSGSIAVVAPELFGGDKREGGIVGFLDVAMGEPAQGTNSYLVSMLGAGIPAFRGILSLIWRGGLVTSNNPYVKPWAFRVKNIVNGWSTGTAWYPEKAQISGQACSLRLITPELVLDALDADGVGVNGGTYFLSPSDTLTIEYTQGLTYDAFSYFQTDGDPAAAGLPWSCQVSVIADGVTTHYRTTRYATAVAASAAAIASGPITITGHSAYTVFIWDTFATNNRGGLSLKISATPVHSDMNPAHIVYRCLTDTNWGMGYPTGAIDSASFLAAADTMYAEGFGLSLLWNKQESIEAFISIVLDHIGGMLYVKPDTGYFALKLIRSDYDRGTLPLYGPETLVSVEDYQRQAWGETINEITVVYTDPCTSKETSITAQDIANIQTQGGVVAQTRNYSGICNNAIAQRVALRDLQAASTPLARIKITATRAAWAVFPGDVFRLTWPDYGISDVVYRALNVNLGTLQDGQIIIDAVEDVFGLPANTYLVDQPSEWEDPSSAPAAAPYRALIEAPYWDLVRSLSAADMAYVDPLAGYLETLAVRPSNDAVDYSIYARTGAAAYTERGAGDFCPSATIIGALTKTTTAITLANGIDLDLVTSGGYAIIESEYVLVSAINWIAGTATISRGILDTLPSAHTAGSRIWFADGWQGYDPTEATDAEVVDVKLLPRTGQGELAISEAPADSITFDQRQYRPYAPGKLLVNTGIYPEWIDGQAELAVSWAHRDRLEQTAYLVEQSEASIGPEASVTYDLRIYGEADTLIHTEAGLSGTGYTYPAASEGVDSGLGDDGDANWANVITLLNFPGADGSTTITDEKGRTWTAVGNAQIDTSLGYNTLLLDGTGDHVTTPHTTDFDWWNNDYTMEAWVNPVDLATWNYVDGFAFSVMLGHRDVAGTECSWGFGPLGDGSVQFRYFAGATYSLGTAAGLITTGSLVHIAMSKIGTTIRLAVAGVIRANGTRAGTSPPAITRPVVIGQGNNRSLSGRIKAILLTKGVGKFSSDFTPPPAPFPAYAKTGRDFNGRLRVELEAKRGGLVSYQKHNHTVLREGYGFNYGYYYGGQ